ncbi:helix-turn-helix domain-containing protein [Streptomyces sp. NPDC058254]|uniref:helix-turn-helix domain-containing protein n=1 Tax=Streptomyces sp. NPDC058254 TaxID=3346406 RepID=UPI0036E06F5F
MSTDFQKAREALGARLRELRTGAGLEGKELAERLGWQRSKVSRLQNGKQTPSLSDLSAWAHGVGQPDAEAELKGMRAAFELKHRAWRRQLASGGHRARQELAIKESAETQLIRALEVSRIPGLLQTAAYARRLFETNADFREVPPTTDAAVDARLRRQETLYEPGKKFRFLLAEGALYHRSCPCDVMAEQLDWLWMRAGLSSVELGILPFGTELRRTVPHGFWIYDRRRVIVETLVEELWHDDEHEVRTYEKAWDWLAESAVYGAPAHRLIARARASLDLT